MGTLADKLAYLSDTKSAIRNAIGSDSITDDTPFRDYASVITDKLNNIVYHEVIGSTIAITDAINAKIDSVKIFGKSTQNGTPSPANPVEITGLGDSGSVKVFSRGRNLIDASKITTHTAGGATVTNNGDGSFTVSGSGTTTATFSKSYEYTLEEMGIITPGTYTFSTGGVSTTPYMGIQFRKADGSATSMVSNNSALSGNTGGTFTITQDMIDEGYKLKPTFYCPSGATIVEGTFYPMCYKGTETLDFEPFAETAVTIAYNLPLDSVPVDTGGTYTDANGQQQICNYIDVLRYAGVQQVDTVICDDANKIEMANTSANASIQQFNITVPAMDVLESEKSICNAMEHATGTISTTGGYKLYSSTMIVVGMPKSVLIDYGLVQSDTSTYLAAFKAWIKENPIVFKYALKTPIVTSLLEEQTEAFANLYTSTTSTTITNSIGADMAVVYLKR